MIMRIIICLLVSATAWGANLAPDFREWRGYPPTDVFQKEIDGHTVLGVSGKQTHCATWSTKDLKLTPGGAYMLRFKANVAGTGLLFSGLESVNRDWPVSPRLFSAGFAFRVPDQAGPAGMRLGHWQLKGEAVFDQVELYPVHPVHRRWGRLELGDGERIENGVYIDRHIINWRGTTIHRTLYQQKARFNSDRWCFFQPGMQLIYKHALPGDMLDGAVHVNISSSIGSFVVSASQDGNNWTRLGQADKPGGFDFKLPTEMFPARTIYVRLESAGAGANLTVTDYSFKARTKAPADYIGQTQLIEENQLAPGLAVTAEGADNGLLLHWRNTTAVARKLNLRVAAGEASRSSCALQVPAQGEALMLVALEPFTARLDKPVTASLALPLPSGMHNIKIVANEGDANVAELTMGLTCPVIAESLYGYRCSNDPPGVAAWWCEGAWKVGARRGVPAGRQRGILIEAARGEFEAAQLVLNPGNAENSLQALEIGELKGEKGSIPGSAVEVYEVATVKVDKPSDHLGEPGNYPDPLPPLALPLQLPANRNQALWILAHVPDNVPAGSYKGEIKIKTATGTGSVELQLQVFDFNLPKETHLRSGFGMGLQEIKRYHQLKTREQEQAVYEKYLRSFAEHRLSPYSFYDYSPVQVKFAGLGAERKVVVDWELFDAAAKRHLDEAGFNGFRFNLEGLGGGFGGAKDGTADYERLWGDYLRQVESHLREKGWLRRAYVYWFDEAEPKDYPKVIERNDRIKKYAPGLARLLTSSPATELNGHVDIWCAQTQVWTPKIIQERQAAGGEVWWYICCSPKAPYVSEFIEHPAIEMRLWAWQSWQYGVRGLLIWHTTYWTSWPAFPDSLQNPWQDAMSWAGSGVSKGDRLPWGNGDGRYFYPPRRDPNQSAEPCLDGPISSLRLENLRDGMEDYEYLWLLRQQIDRIKAKADGKLLAEAQALLTVPETISKDTANFSNDARPIMEQRRKIAAMIEKLQKL